MEVADRLQVVYFGRENSLKLDGHGFVHFFHVQAFGEDGVWWVGLHCFGYEFI